MDEIGGQLREARMRLRLDTAEIEASTKIRAKYLRAMENEEWDLLPGEVYVRSFLRTYADFLGLDSRQLLDEFRRRHESPADHEPPPIAPPSRERREREQRRRRSGRGGRGVGVPPWAIVVAVLVVVGVVLYLVGKNNGTPQSGANVPRNTQTHTSSATAHRHHHPPVRHVKRKPKSVTLSLVPTSAVWVCLVNGAGKALIDGQTYDPGQTIPAETGHMLLLLLGNNAMTIKENGVAVTVPASSGPIGLRFTPAGHTTLTAGHEPTCSS